jgi:non-specific serine/threonine protein kinase
MPLHEQALELRRSLGDKRGLAASLHNMGITMLHLPDLDRAEALCTESRALWRDVGDDRGVAISLNSSAILARNRGDHERAQAYYDESLALFEGLGDRRGVAWVLSNLTVVAGRRGQWEQAARLHGAAEALREAIGAFSFGLSPAEQAAHQATVVETRARLGEERFAEAIAAGRALPPRAVAFEPATSPAEAQPTAMEIAAPAQPAPAHRPSPLTRREREVTTLVARGLTDRQIAEALVITEGTVGVHLNHIFGKLEIRTRAQLAVWAAEQGLLPGRG